MSETRVTFDFSGCRVLVTGGTSGIGAGIARGFADAGADVSITGTRASASEYDADLSGYAYHALQMTDPDAIGPVAEAVGPVDVLVNNAGASFPVGDEWTPEGFEGSVRVNLFGAFRMSLACKAALQASQLAGGGNVVNLASMSSYFAVPVVPGYGAAKAGVVQMTKNMGVTWAGDGVRVNAVAPGLIESNMTAPMKAIEGSDTEMMQRTAMGRWGTPDDITPTVLFLASPAARYVTGQTWNIDGGFSAA